MKGIVEQYARGEFNVERPDIDISIAKLELAVEAGSIFQEPLRWCRRMMYRSN